MSHHPHRHYQSPGFSCLGLALLAFFLGVLGCRGRARHASVDAGGPRIAFETTVHDFGTVTEGDKLRHVFVVKNTGNAPLLIDGAHASCGCTVAALKSKSIAPGGMGEIDATFDTQGRVAAARTTITVDSNATDQPHATVTLSANVERLLALESGYVRVATEWGVPHAERVWLTGKLLGEATPKLLKLESQRYGHAPAEEETMLSELSVRPIEEEAGGTTRKGLELSLKGRRVGSGSGKATITTGLPRPAQLELNLTWGVAGTLSVDPESLSFAAGQDRILRVWSKKPNFKLSQVRVLDGPFVATIEKPESPAVFKVKVTWNGSPPAERPGKLQLISNDSAEPKRLVELRIVQAPSPPPQSRIPR